MTEAII